MPLPLARAALASPPQQSASSAAAVHELQRLAELQRLLPLWPAEIADRTPEGRRRLLGTLRRALREERRRGLCGHWAYDLGRHAALFRIYQAEVASERAGRPRDARRRDGANPIPP